jgi:hypothetical protein
LGWEGVPLCNLGLDAPRHCVGGAAVRLQHKTTEALGMRLYCKLWLAVPTKNTIYFP